MACDRCRPCLGDIQDGDVTQCTACGQWWRVFLERAPGERPLLAVEPITPAQAGALARGWDA